MIPMYFFFFFLKEKLTTECQTHQDCMSSLKLNNVVCAKAKNGSRFCNEFSCKSDDACPSETICHENSQEKYCSGI